MYNVSNMSLNTQLNINAKINNKCKVKCKYVILGLAFRGSILISYYNIIVAFQKIEHVKLKIQNLLDDLYK